MSKQMQHRKLPSITHLQTERSPTRGGLADHRTFVYKPSQSLEKGSPKTPVILSSKVSRVSSMYSGSSNQTKTQPQPASLSSLPSPRKKRVTTATTTQSRTDNKKIVPTAIVPPDILEIIKDKLYWVSCKSPPIKNSNTFYFCIDNVLQYEPFFADFGPNNLASTYKFSVELNQQLLSNKFIKSKIFHYTGIDQNKRTNAAYLMGAYQVMILGRSADEAWRSFENVAVPFKTYRDASYGECTYKCSILDCLRGLEYGIKLKWFNMKTFNLTEYEYFERVENGDLSVVLPGKFIAFSGPSSSTRSPDGYRTLTPEDYVPIFKEMGVKLVIRLNTKSYEASRFTDNGIKHLDLFFPDGSCPPDNILEQFLSVCENKKGIIAVHCMAGLGRTGTLIGMYAMKHYHFTAADFIGWIRIVRPGSILGPQQFYLNQRQAEMWKSGSNSPIWLNAKHLVDGLSKINARFDIEDRGEISPDQLRIAVNGEKNQGEGLVVSKLRTGVIDKVGRPNGRSAYKTSIM